MASMRRVPVLLAAAALLVSGASALSFLSAPAAAYTPHGPILITGNSGFTSANGVTGGRGTPADPFVIRGWSIDASSADGIVVRNSTAPFRILDVLIYSGGLAHSGIVLQNVSSAVVGNATITKDATGILVEACTNVTLAANAVMLNTWEGISMYDSRDIVLNGNNITYNRDGVSLQRVRGVRLTGNGVWLNNQDGAYFGNLTDAFLAGGAFSSNAWAGVDLQGGQNVTVLANTAASNGRQGMLLNAVEGLNVSSNSVFLNTATGILVSNAANVSAFSNDVSAPGSTGIIVEQTRHLRMVANRASQGDTSAILLGSVDDADLESNTITNNGIGLSAVGSNHLSVHGNLIATNRLQAIYLIGVHNGTLAANNVSRNQNGIVFESTLNVTIRDNSLWQNGYGVFLITSRGILVANNTFETNLPQAYDDSGGANRWDSGYPAGGNYWSDYVGQDLCAGANQSVCIDPDGIGDTPYTVTGNSVDRYPLMRPRGVSSQPPVAAFLVSPRTGNTETLFTLDASPSYDLQDIAAALLVRWDFNGDGVWDTPWSYNRTAVHAFSQAGVYSVRLQVLDQSGRSNQTAQVIHVAASHPPSLLEQIWPQLLLLGLGVVLLVDAVYSRVRARWPRKIQPAWRLHRRMR